MSLALLLSVGAYSITAYALDPIISPQTTQSSVVIEVTLNGEDSPHVSYKPDPNDSNTITFTYTGDGEFIGWEFPNKVEGVDYEIIEDNGESITIKILNGFDDHTFDANAIDKRTTTSPAKKDRGSKSPKTGAASGLMLASIGVATLLIAKKKENN